MTTTDPRLQPRNGQLYIVRWIREGARADVKHRHFTREHDARQFLDKLHKFGKTAAIFTTRTQWDAVDGLHRRDRSGVGSHVQEGSR